MLPPRSSRNDITLTTPEPPHTDYVDVCVSGVALLEYVKAVAFRWANPQHYMSILNTKYYGN